jgi:hypothetical protein
VALDLAIEVAARIAGDAAIIASGVAPSNVGIAPVIGTGTSVARTVADRFGTVEGVSVLDFGADPTGVSDSRAAIQAAIDSGAKRIHLPAGTYSILSALIFAKKEGITFYGDGRSDTTIQYTGTNHASSVTYPAAAPRTTLVVPFAAPGNGAIIVKAGGIYTTAYTVAGDITAGTASIVFWSATGEEVIIRRASADACVILWSSSYNRIQGIKFCTAGADIRNSATWTCDFGVYLFNHDSFGGALGARGLCQYNTIEECTAQTFAKSGYQMGFEGSGWLDTNTDGNRFIECYGSFCDVGIHIRQTNTNLTRVIGGGYTENTVAGLKVDGYARGVEIDAPMFFMNGRTGGTDLGSEFLLTNEVNGPMSIRNIVTEMYYATWLRVEASSGGRSNANLLTLENINCTSNLPAAKRIIDFQGAGCTTLRNCRFAGGAEGRGEPSGTPTSALYFHCANAGVGGQRSLITENVELSDGAYWDVDTTAGTAHIDWIEKNTKYANRAGGDFATEILARVITDYTPPGSPTPPYEWQIAVNDTSPFAAGDWLDIFAYYQAPTRAQGTAYSPGAEVVTVDSPTQVTIKMSDGSNFHGNIKALDFCQDPDAGNAVVGIITADQPATTATVAVHVVSSSAMSPGQSLDIFGDQAGAGISFRDTHLIVVSVDSGTLLTVRRLDAWVPVACERGDRVSRHFDARNRLALRGSQGLVVEGNTLALAASTGVTVLSQNEITRSCITVEIRKEAWTAAAASQYVYLASLKPRTRIVGAYLETTEALAGLAGTIQATLEVQGSDLIPAHDVKTAAVVKGPLLADLGASSKLLVANASMGAYIDTAGWNGIVQPRVKLTSGTGNIGTGSATHLTAGLMRAWIIIESLP